MAASHYQWKAGEGRALTTNPPEIELGPEMSAPDAIGKGRHEHMHDVIREASPFLRIHAARDSRCNHHPEPITARWTSPASEDASLDPFLVTWKA